MGRSAVRYGIFGHQPALLLLLLLLHLTGSGSRPAEMGEEADEKFWPLDKQVAFVQELITKERFVHAMSVIGRLDIASSVDIPGLFDVLFVYAKAKERYRDVFRVLKKTPPNLLTDVMLQGLIQRFLDEDAFDPALETVTLYPDLSGPFNAENIVCDAYAKGRLDVVAVWINKLNLTTFSEQEIVNGLIRRSSFGVVSAFLKGRPRTNRVDCLRRALQDELPKSVVLMLAKKLNLEKDLGPDLPTIHDVRLPIEGSYLHLACDETSAKAALVALKSSLSRSTKEDWFQRPGKTFTYDFTKAPDMTPLNSVLSQVTLDEHEILRRRVQDFSRSADAQCQFESTLNSFERSVVHETCRELGLFSRTLQQGGKKQLIVTKSSIPSDLIEIVQSELVAPSAAQGVAAQPTDSEASEGNIAAVLAQVQTFLEDETATKLEIAPGVLSGSERARLHSFSDKHGLKQLASGTKNCRGIILLKETHVPSPNRESQRRERSQSSLKGVIGLDTESQPARQKGEQKRAALLQVSTPDTAVVFDLMSLFAETTSKSIRDEVAGFLKDCFTNPSIMKIGCGFDEDLAEMRGTLPHLDCFDKVNSYLDINTAVRQHCTVDEKVSLQRLCQMFLGMDLNKKRQCSNWAMRPLSFEQFEYAANDAFILIALCARLQYTLDSWAELSHSAFPIHLPDIQPYLARCRTLGN